MKALTPGGLAVAVLLAFFVRTAAYTPAKEIPPPKAHTYYIAADEVQWNYLPSTPTYALGSENEINPAPMAKSNRYLKAVYREYTDDTFTTLKQRPAAWEHLGILGPLIRAEVSDVVKVVFKNNTRLICSMHPHGLAYDKDSEGAYYSNGPGSRPIPAKKAMPFSTGRCSPTLGRCRSEQGRGQAIPARSCGCITHTSTSRGT